MSSFAAGLMTTPSGMASIVPPLWRGLSVEQTAACGRIGRAARVLYSTDYQTTLKNAYRAVFFALALTAASCASRAPIASSPAVPQSHDDVAALLRHGCYRCLEKAFAEAQARGARDLAFEAAALLVLRSKELGLPYAGWMDFAQSLAGPESKPVLTMIEAMPLDPLSGDPDAVLNFSGRIHARTSMSAWRDLLQHGPWSELFREYLDVSLVCAFGRLLENDESFTGPLDAVAEAPLYQYRIGICDRQQWQRLTAFRERHPDYVDADFPLGRSAFEDPVNPDHEEGLRRLESAVEAFPGSPAIGTTIGNVYRAWEEWESALDAYDRVIAIAPDHPEALLGRTVSLSRLGRSNEAIATATRVIDGGRWRLGEAYYWRGWNHLVRGDAVAARGDADRAKRLMANAAVFVLSGAIEWRLQRREEAEKEFEQALLMDLGECEAAFNLGVVRDELGKMPEAAAAFTQARQCYDLSIALRRDAIAKIRSGPGNEATKTRAAALHERALQDHEARRNEALRLLEHVRKRSRTAGQGVHQPRL
jgi:tetratricopeptide (TPR) repeat protein